MQIASAFPPESAEWTFFVAALVLLAGPLVAERLRLPGIVGVLLGGLLVGPFVLGWIEREGIVEPLGELGLLYLMFLAGLELDLDEFARNRRPALTFGSLTFAIPFTLGLLLVLPFGYGFATAALYGSLWASHTLVAYPIVQEHGLTRSRAVGMTASGTVMTDTLALFVLALVAGSVESDDRPTVLVVKLVAGLLLLVAYCALVLPRLARWAFALVGGTRTARLLVLLVSLTSAALLADRAGIEGIVGAFFAGLALNRLVPARSPLMERVEFLGAVLLVPFFLLSTGMLIDPAKFTEGRVLLVAGLSLAVVVIGKAAAALAAGRIEGFSRDERQLVFGLSLAQAAATLAAVTIGVEIGLFDDDLLNATLVVVLVTVILASIATRLAASKIEPPAVAADRLAETLLVQLGDDDDGAVALAARIAVGKGGVLLTAAVAPPGSEEGRADARVRAQAAAERAASLGAEPEAIVRVDASNRDALEAITAEHAVTLALTGWHRDEPAPLPDTPLLLVAGDPGDPARIVLSLDSRDLGRAGSGDLDLAVAVARLLSVGLRVRVAVLAPDEQAVGELAARIGEAAESLPDSRPRIDAIADHARAGDLVLVPSHPGSTAHRDAVSAALRAGCAAAVTVRPARREVTEAEGALVVAGRAA